MNLPETANRKLTGGGRTDTYPISNTVKGIQQRERCCTCSHLDHSLGVWCSLQSGRRAGDCEDPSHHPLTEQSQRQSLPLNPSALWIKHEKELVSHNLTSYPQIREDFLLYSNEKKKYLPSETHAYYTSLTSLSGLHEVDEHAVDARPLCQHQRLEGKWSEQIKLVPMIDRKPWSWLSVVKTPLH